MLFAFTDDLNGRGIVLRGGAAPEDGVRPVKNALPAYFGERYLQAGGGIGDSHRGGRMSLLHIRWLVFVVLKHALRCCATAGWFEVHGAVFNFNVFFSLLFCSLFLQLPL